MKTATYVALTDSQAYTRKTYDLLKRQGLL